VTEVNADPVPTGPENPHGNAFRVGRGRPQAAPTGALAAPVAARPARRRGGRPQARGQPQGARLASIPLIPSAPETPQVSETPLLSVHSAMREADPWRSRAWKVKNPKVRTPRWEAPAWGRGAPPGHACC
jgi:Cu2+-containing amine oxidase